MTERVNTKEEKKHSFYIYLKWIIESFHQLKFVSPAFCVQDIEHNYRLWNNHVSNGQVTLLNDNKSIIEYTIFNF